MSLAPCHFPREGYHARLKTWPSYTAKVCISSVTSSRMRTIQWMRWLWLFLKSGNKPYPFPIWKLLGYTPCFIFAVEETLIQAPKTWRGIFAWLRIPIVVLATAFPVVFAKHIESLELTFLGAFILVVAGAAVAEHYYDREAEAELDDARRRLQLQTNAGPTMARLLAVVEAVSRASSEKRGSFTAEQSQAFAKIVEESIVEVLKAVCTSVWTYWNSPGSHEPNFFGSVMYAYDPATCGVEKIGELERRAKFLQYKRSDLRSYKRMLDVLFWSDDIPQFVRIAIPVEDENSDEGRKLLLPGAPTAYALGEDVVIPDTHDLRKHSGSNLPDYVLKQEQEYFDQRKIRSMACLILHAKRDKKENQNRMGVLNIHSEKVNLLGSSEEEQKTLIQCLEHYRGALEYLVDAWSSIG